MDYLSFTLHVFGMTPPATLILSGNVSHLPGFTHDYRDHLGSVSVGHEFGTLREILERYQERAGNKGLDLEVEGYERGFGTTEPLGREDIIELKTLCKDLGISYSKLTPW